MLSRLLVPEFCHSPCSPSSFGGPQPPAKVTDPLGTVMRKLAPCLTLLFLQLSQAAHVPFQACAVGTRFNCLARDGTWIDKDPTCRHARPIFGLTLPGKRGKRLGNAKKGAATLDPFSSILVGMGQNSKHIKTPAWQRSNNETGRRILPNFQEYRKDRKVRKKCQETMVDALHLHTGVSIKWGYPNSSLSHPLSPSSSPYPNSWMVYGKSEHQMDDARRYPHFRMDRKPPHLWEILGSPKLGQSPARHLGLILRF